MRGAELPSFYTIMILKEKAKQLLEAGLEKHPDLFLIDFEVSASGKIVVTLDGDNGVTLQDCIDISRAVEHELDREEFDFSIDVASAGIGSPLRFVRQYKKNIGRNLSVKTVSEGDFEGVLVDANDDFISLQWKAREPKALGKGKETVLKTKEIAYDQIRTAVIKLIF